METYWVLFLSIYQKHLTLLVTRALLISLPSYGINNKELHWFTDYLFSQMQSVQFKGILSDTNPIFSGVPQGSIFGLLLLTIHFNDVHTPLESTSIITHADDSNFHGC